MVTEIIITHVMELQSERKTINRRHFEILFFSDLFKKTGFAISGKLSPKETVYMKCHTLFSENKYQIVTLGVVKIKLETIS